MSSRSATDVHGLERRQHTQTSGESQSQAREKALKRALAMIGEKLKSKRAKHSKKSHHTSHSRHASRKHAHRAK